MMFIATGMLMMAGVLAELLIRIYHESQGLDAIQDPPNLRLRITNLNMGHLSSFAARITIQQRDLFPEDDLWDGIDPPSLRCLE